jgi:hypothetical protein
MNALAKPVDKALPRQRAKAKTFPPRPLGELDYDALASEVLRKYPRILARLGE